MFAAIASFTIDAAAAPQAASLHIDAATFSPDIFRGHCHYASRQLRQRHFIASRSAAIDTPLFADDTRHDCCILRCWLRRCRCCRRHYDTLIIITLLDYATLAIDAAI